MSVNLGLFLFLNHVKTLKFISIISNYRKPRDPQCWLVVRILRRSQLEPHSSVCMRRKSNSLPGCPSGTCGSGWRVRLASGNPACTWCRWKWTANSLHPFRSLICNCNVLCIVTLPHTTSHSIYQTVRSSQDSPKHRCCTALGPFCRHRRRGHGILAVCLPVCFSSWNVRIMYPSFSIDLLYWSMTQERPVSSTQIENSPLNWTSILLVNKRRDWQTTPTSEKGATPYSG